MVELRKRKAPANPPVPEKKTKAPKPQPDVDADVAADVDVDVKKSSKVPEVDDIIDIESFGGEVQTNDGETTSLKKLLDESKAGVVFFTYPKASTPGCTKQACLFRDNHTHLTSSGLSIYGLSGDSPKANTTFKTRQNLQYPLLCDPQANLIAAIGLKKSPKGTIRGVFAVDKKGKVLLRESGGPDATVDAVQKIVANAPKLEEKEAEPETKPDDKDEKDEADGSE
ncbi:Alkyl hydroperoxide reductase subunit C/ Thiol specific antioxidant [Penicillium brevicompactum]|uniref:Alkyl hydroperoxide reductase subunit C/ Thiol specific antioxidant n=1 Tax=Penicillium brevicompactum TaxID=5074 RepID=UPI002541FC03|nr:Alkyl hydroperoxide reductase subunit C/ Thiol specific antioxidant [Penicillium brevicompactum]KAJ5319429.1 Alkyl hydroperoxide reductase subunit C/ Thiol specific antioxidant [Penicillium brevicompactum]